MKNLIKTLIVLSTVSALSAQAENDLAAKFAYSASDPVETTYANFAATAEKACKINRAEVAELYTRSRMEKACRTELMNKAVAASQLQGLAAYHAQMMGSRLAVVLPLEQGQALSAR